MISSIIKTARSILGVILHDYLIMRKIKFKNAGSLGSNSDFFSKKYQKHYLPIKESGKIKKDSKMKITILGSGTAAPRLNRNMSGYLLEADGKKILFDSGPGTIRQLLQINADILDIDYIFYTHMHNDHINDLGAIIWSNNYGIFRKKALNLYGPKGFKKYFKTLVRKILKPTKLYYGINIKQMGNNSLIKIPTNENNIIIRSIKSKHMGASSVSYRIDYSNKSIVYSGDTEYCNEIIEISENADLLILECSFPYKTDSHLDPSLCGKVATKANAKKLVLTHFYPECDKADVKKQCSKEFNGEIVVAKDFLRIKV